MGVIPKGVVWRVAIALVAAVVIALAVRVATDPDDPVSTEPAVARDADVSAVVGTADFEQAGARSPGATVLRWWQSNQFRRPVREVAAHYTADSRPSLGKLRADLKLVRYIFTSTKPLVVDQRTEGDTAQVFTLIAPPDERPGSRDSTTYVFAVERERGRWKLADTYLADRATAERDAIDEDRRRR